MIIPKIGKAKYNLRDQSLLRKRQQWVLHRPCMTFQECGRLGYRAIFESDSGVRFITVLTIDLFSQPWAWHSQIGIIGETGKAKGIHQFTLPERYEAVELAMMLVSGVGEGRARFEKDNLSIGFARTLTLAETYTAMSCQGNAPQPDVFPVGEIGLFDESDKSTQIGDCLFIPKTRSVIYGRGN